METLAIIAYKQPMSKTDVERIRGVNSDYTFQKLLEKELIVISGRSDAPGRPLLYSTSDKFMDYLGLKSLADLPKLKDFQMTENEIGTPTAMIDEPAENDESREG
jgi:segregation and condensation protein B